MSVRSISAGQTRRLRHTVLRPDQPWEATDYPGDTDPLTLHVGSFDGDDLVAIGSVYREAPAGDGAGEMAGDGAGEMAGDGAGGMAGDGAGDMWRLRGMATAGHAGRRGHASGVLRAVIGHVARLGGARLWCNARTPAAGFYARHGFTRVGEEFMIFPIGPHVVMQRAVLAADAALALATDPAAACVTTPRLRLRAWRAGDGDALAGVDADPQTTLAELVGHWELHGFGPWAVEERADGRLIGRAGLWHPPDWADPELRCLLSRAWRGRGLGTEAAHAALAYGFARRRMDRITSIVGTADAASARLATRLGMALEGETTWRAAPVRWYALTRGEWERALRR